MMLQPQQYERLGALYNQLRPSDHSPVPSVLEVSSKPNKRGRPSKSPKEGPKINDCWKGVKDLVQLILEPELSELIEESKEKPSGELAALFFDRCPKRSRLVGNDGRPEEVLASLCINLAKRTTKSVTDGVRWLFEALAVGDMFVEVFGSDRINRVSSTVKRAVRDAVAQDDRSEDFLKHVKAGMAFACNVYFICDLLGTGSLFFLRPKLTKHL